MNHWKPYAAGTADSERSTQAAWFARDVMAGLVLTTMLVPVGIAYALA